MKKFHGTVTLAILDEDNSQRVIFRIFPLSNKDGFIFDNRKVSYPDFGSLRIIPDKREQSSFKERMRDMGKLCCVQLLADGKELTKIRQNRNYDPNKGEYNQYAIYSDVVCGFEHEAVFEVFQENDDYTQALTEYVLIQRGMMLYGPLHKAEQPVWETIKPFGNEKYLLHTVNTNEGEQRTYYWNPEAVVTWRQRKKAMRKKDMPAETVPAEAIEEEAPAKEQAQEPEHTADTSPQTPDSIPIGSKLTLLDEDRSHDEHISELNKPLSIQANLLASSEKPIKEEASSEIPFFHGTPMAESQKPIVNSTAKDTKVHFVVEKQLKEHHASKTTAHSTHTAIADPIENLRAALTDVWHQPALHQDLLRIVEENREIAKAILKSAFFDQEAQTAYSAAKAEMNEIEGQRISLLVELDKVKTDYQKMKEKILSEISGSKKQEIARLEAQLQMLKSEKETLEGILAVFADETQKEAAARLFASASMSVASNGSDITITPTVGYQIDKWEVVENTRVSLNEQGFLCKQDCVMELLVLLSLHDEICLLADTIWEAELYIKNVLQSLGLMNVTAWPSVFGTIRVLNILPENDLRTPTVEVIKNNRMPIRAFGHKAIRLVEINKMEEITGIPILKIPPFCKDHGKSNLHENGKPISIQTLNAFSENAPLIYKDGEALLDIKEKQMRDLDIELTDEALHLMRVYTRITAPQVVGGLMEAADAAVIAWLLATLVKQRISREKVMALIGDLPRSMQLFNSVID